MCGYCTQLMDGRVIPVNLSTHIAKLEQENADLKAALLVAMAVPPLPERKRHG